MLVNFSAAFGTLIAPFFLIFSPLNSGALISAASLSASMVILSHSLFLALSLQAPFPLTAPMFIRRYIGFGGLLEVNKHRVSVRPL